MTGVYTCLQDAEPLTLITTIQAEDPDFQLNGIIIYTFENLTTSKGPFQIDRETGEVTLRSGPEGRLDRETEPSYDVSIHSEWAVQCLKFQPNDNM